MKRMHYEKTDLLDVADALMDGYEKTINVGPAGGTEHDVHIESTTAYASRFLAAIALHHRYDEIMRILATPKPRDMRFSTPDTKFVVVVGEGRKFTSYYCETQDEVDRFARECYTSISVRDYKTDELIERVIK